MIRKLISFFYSELRGMHNAAIVLGVATISSSILALFRDRLLAGTFGAGKDLDIYYAAFRIPDAIYTIFLVLVSVTALIPILLERVESDDPDDEHKFLDSVLTVFLLAMIAVSGVVFLFTPWIVRLIAPGFASHDASTLVNLTRIMLLSPLLLGISNIFSGIIQSMRRFVVYALSPIFYNVGIIIGIVLFFPAWGLPGLALGVVLGAFMHLAVQIPGAIRLGLVPRITAYIDGSAIKRVVMLSLPRSLGLSLNQLVFIGIVAAGSLIGAGSISVFNLAFNLQSVPLAVIGISYSIAAFPTLARLFVQDKHKEYVAHVTGAARSIIFLALPVSALFIVLRAQIVRVIFGHGEFGWVDTRLTAAALGIFAVSILGQALLLLFVRAYYAAGRTVKPIVINALSSVSIIVLSFLLTKIFYASGVFRSAVESIFRVDGVPGTAVLILASAFSIGMLANAIVLYLSFRKDFRIENGRVRRTVSQSLLATVALGTATYGMLQFLDTVFNIQTFVGVLSQGFVAGMIGGAVWLSVLLVIKNKDLRNIRISLRRYLARALGCVL